MKTFCKAHDAEPGGILCTAPKVSSPRRSPAGHQQRRKGALRAAAGQSEHFPAERLCRAGRQIRLYFTSEQAQTKLHRSR